MAPMKQLKDLTIEEARNMPAGRECRRLVAEAVGWDWAAIGDPSNTITAAWAAALALRPCGPCTGRVRGRACLSGRRARPRLRSRRTSRRPARGRRGWAAPGALTPSSASTRWRGSRRTPGRASSTPRRRRYSCRCSRRGCSPRSRRDQRDAWRGNRRSSSVSPAGPRAATSRPRPGFAGSRRSFPSSRPIS